MRKRPEGRGGCGVAVQRLVAGCVAGTGETAMVEGLRLWKLWREV